MQKFSATVRPTGSMMLLSKVEIEFLKKRENSDIYNLFRNCCLAVLTAGAHLSDDPTELLETYSDFEVTLDNDDRGVLIELSNAPAEAFVDGEIIAGMLENLSAVIRDIIYADSLNRAPAAGTVQSDSERITHHVHSMLRNADALRQGIKPNMVVCWGGHSISKPEYHYAKQVGYELGLRKINICTGCGPGIMYAPMKGAAIGHAKQHIGQQCHLGLTEPGIIASESPNPIVNNLIILPNIQKRLEAFLRVGHVIMVFPGGVGTAEEICHLLGVMLHPENKDEKLPIIFTASEEHKEYFVNIDNFIRSTMGEEAANLYEIIIGDPVQVAKKTAQYMEEVRKDRQKHNEAYHFNWSLKIDYEFQKDFEPTHENMANLNIDPNLPPIELACNLRRLFSGFVAGNIRSDYIEQIKEKGKYQITGDPALIEKLDEMLKGFIAQGRMKLPGTKYEPCYEIVKS